MGSFKLRCQRKAKSKPLPGNIVITREENMMKG